MPDQKRWNKFGAILMAVIALPVAPFIAWQIYCQVVYVNHFEQRCGEELNILLASGHDLMARPKVINQRIDKWYRQYAHLSYVYHGGGGAGSFYCEVNTVNCSNP